MLKVGVLLLKSVYKKPTIMWAWRFLTVNNYALADFLALLIAFSATSAGASTMSA